VLWAAIVIKVKKMSAIKPIIKINQHNLPTREVNLKFTSKSFKQFSVASISQSGAKW
jgi:indole-3-glycerol phosphate synthase